jgi:hypothetical protein
MAYPAHGTPLSVATAAFLTMHDIDLDPASNDAANKVVGAKRYYTKADNGLALPWFGNVFLNPPGGTWKATSKMSEADATLLREHYALAKQAQWWKKTQSVAATWWDRLIWEHKQGHIEQAVFLAFNSEILGNRPEMLQYPICFTTNQATDSAVNNQGRVLFLDETGEPGNAPTHTNALIYLPPKLDTAAWVQRFGQHFARFGTVGQLVRTNVETVPACHRCANYPCMNPSQCATFNDDAGASYFAPMEKQLCNIN